MKLGLILLAGLLVWTAAAHGNRHRRCRDDSRWRDQDGDGCDAYEIHPNGAQFACNYPGYEQALKKCRKTCKTCVSPDRNLEIDLPDPPEWWDTAEEESMWETPEVLDPKEWGRDGDREEQDDVDGEDGGIIARAWFLCEHYSSCYSCMQQPSCRYDAFSRKCKDAHQCDYVLQVRTEDAAPQAMARNQVCLQTLDQCDPVAEGSCERHYDQWSCQSDAALACHWDRWYNRCYTILVPNQSPTPRPTPCNCPPVPQCGRDQVSVVVPGTEHNCCGGEHRCVGVCEQHKHWWHCQNQRSPRCEWKSWQNSCQLAQQTPVNCMTHTSSGRCHSQRGCYWNWRWYRCQSYHY